MTHTDVRPPRPVPAQRPLTALRPHERRVTVSLPGAPPVLRAGVRHLLAGFADRVAVVPEGADCDVQLVDDAYSLGPAGPVDGSVPMVVLVRDGDAAAAHRARQRGAAVVLPASVEGPALLGALETAARNGEVPVAPPGVLEDLATALSRREREVVAGICAGLSNEEIARELYLSINSVKSYVRTAYRKMGVTRRPQAVAWGIEQGYGTGTLATG